MRTPLEKQRIRVGLRDHTTKAMSDYARRDEKIPYADSEQDRKQDRKRLPVIENREIRIRDSRYSATQIKISQGWKDWKGPYTTEVAAGLGFQIPMIVPTAGGVSA